MKIIVNHLTRMQPGFICVAGINVDSWKHVRPTLAERLSASLLARNGGPFDIGHVVDIGPAKCVGSAPEMEDHRFEPRTARHIQTIAPGQFWSSLQRVSVNSLREIFGPDLTRRGSASCTVDVGKGRISLGCLVPAGQPNLYLKARPDKPDQVRMHVWDGRFDLDLGVTDIRLYGNDHGTPDERLVEQINRRLAAGIRVILSMGLTRPFAPSPDHPAVHWLQVNNIHLEDDPLWRLG